MKLELKHLTPYLPYKLVAMIEDVPCRIEGCDLDHEGTIIAERVNYDLEQVKPILRPLSDLAKEIEHNGEGFVPIRWFELNGYAPGGLEMDGETFVFGDSIMWSVEEIHYNMVQKLFEWHFDIFDLIPQGLAININQL